MYRSSDFGLKLYQSSEQIFRIPDYQHSPFHGYMIILCTLACTKYPYFYCNNIFIKCYNHCFANQYLLILLQVLVKKSLECRDLVDEAKKYHLRPDLRCQMQSARTRPRTGNIRCSYCSLYILTQTLFQKPFFSFFFLNIYIYFMKEFW